MPSAASLTGCPGNFASKAQIVSIFAGEGIYRSLQDRPRVLAECRHQNQDRDKEDVQRVAKNI